VRNEYAGDIGDFAKVALLQALARPPARLGVVWYLNVLPETNRDGTITTFEHLRYCADELFRKISVIPLCASRSVSCLQALIPQAIYYSEPIPYSRSDSRGNRSEQRKGWFCSAMARLAQSDFVFLDPDTGLASDRVKDHHKRAVKYAFAHEISEFLERDKAVILYQHQNRKGDLLQQITEFRQGEFKTAWKFALSFHRQSVRVFHFLGRNDRLTAELRERALEFLKGAWGKDEHFRMHDGG